MSKLAKRNSFDIPDNICLIQEEMQKLPEKIRKLLEVSDKVEYSREKYPLPLSPHRENGGGGNNLFSKDSNTDGIERNFEGLTNRLNRFQPVRHYDHRAAPVEPVQVLHDLSIGIQIIRHFVQEDKLDYDASPFCFK